MDDPGFVTIRPGCFERLGPGGAPHIKPAVILVLGVTAARGVLGRAIVISKARDRTENARRWHARASNGSPIRIVATAHD
jgi:uracil-DNA glycosylase